MKLYSENVYQVIHSQIDSHHCIEETIYTADFKEKTKIFEYKGDRGMIG